MTDKPFNGRVAVVTGAASGIGLAVAERFAEEGAHVALIDCNAEQGRRAQEEIRNRGGKCEFYLADVESENQVRRACESIQQSFPSVHHLVNNAGIVIVKGVEESSVAEWDRVMNVNVRSVFLMTKYLLPGLKAARGGTLVNIGSVSSFVAQRNTPAYVASKGAVAMLSKSLALDLAMYGIRVNCVCPGITDTPMFRFHIDQTSSPEHTLRTRLDRVPLNRALSPREIADTVLYLSSPASSGITGATLLVDAGYLAAAEWSTSGL
jgi:NAD(P)-dependent dehydrogenase (short-subunit alcohol dehydrogenase family)